MDGTAIEQQVNRRKGRCMAQLLEEFERDLQPLLPDDVAKRFKVMVRRKLNGFAGDMIDALELVQDGRVRNGTAVDLEDRLFVDGTRPRETGSKR